MVDMAYGLCENYFMERVQAKQVKQCFGCSEAAGFMDSEGDMEYICPWVEKFVGTKVLKNPLREKMMDGPIAQRERKTLTKTSQSCATQWSVARSQVKQMTWCSWLLSPSYTKPRERKKNKNKQWMNTDLSRTGSFFLHNRRDDSGGGYFSLHKAC